MKQELKKDIKQILKSAAGNALLTVIMTSVAVGAGAVLLTKTGGMRMMMNADINQNTLIENTMFEIKTYLADDQNCKVALDSNFTDLGKYSVGADIDSNTKVESIKDQNPGARTRTILFVFKKTKSTGETSRKPDKVQIQTYEVPSPANPAVKIPTCTSFETTGVDASVKRLCESLGGEYDELKGSCDLKFDNSGFTDDLNLLSCEALGGVYSSGTCSQIDIAGSIQSGHFKTQNIQLSGVARTDSKTQNCGPTQIASGINQDGSINCKNIACPSPSGAGASTYRPRVVSNQLYCECDRRRGSELDCGSENPNRNACSDITVSDGCGTGNTCVIRRHRSICPRAAACGEVIRDQCGAICSRGPPCPVDPPPPIDPPPSVDPDPPADPCAGKPPASTVCAGDNLVPGAPSCGKGSRDCTTCNPSWVPGRGTTCSNTTLTQTDGCGEERTVRGTKAPSWTPTNLSNTCTTDTILQTDGCGGRRNISGIKACGCTEGARKRLASWDNEQCCIQRSSVRGCTEPGVGMATCSGGVWINACEDPRGPQPTCRNGETKSDICSNPTPCEPGKRSCIDPVGSFTCVAGNWRQNSCRQFCQEIEQACI